jgi:hypothetical protein
MTMSLLSLFDFRAREVACWGAVTTLAAAALTVVSPVAVATTETVCDGTIGRRVVERVVVPNGATCRLNGTRVRQNVVVGTGEALVARGARILGSVQATEGPRSVRLLDTDVLGNIHVREARGVVLIGNSGCGLDPVAGNNIHLVENNGRIGICRMSIEGNLHLIDNSDTVFVRSNNVGNNLHAVGNHGGFLRLRGNRVGTRSNGNLVVENNRTATRLRTNRASNHLVCRANRTIDGFGNRAAGGMRHQCANLR